MNRHFHIKNGELIETGEREFSSAGRILEPCTLFESMRLWKGKILFEEYHKDRFEKGMKIFGYPIQQISWNRVKDDIQKLTTANGLQASARIRIKLVKNGETDVLTVETWDLPPYQLPARGLKTDIFPNGKKEIDALSNLKKGSYMFYSEALQFVKENKLDDVIVLNSHDHVCESTISNIFWLQDGQVFTVPLSEGPVAGAMRNYLIDKMDVVQTSCTINDLMNADEIFLTNVIRGIQPVSEFCQLAFGIGFAKDLFEVLLLPLTKP